MASSPSLSAAPPGSEVGAHPRHLPLERYLLLTVVTLGLYPFYLISCQSRDLKAITGRERVEFTALLILGVITFSFLLLVMQVLWAYDLQRHGQTVNQPGRQEALGTLVLVLTVLAAVLGYAIDNLLAAYLVGTVFSAAALWLLQKEINLYATAPPSASR